MFFANPPWRTLSKPHRRFTTREGMLAPRACLPLRAPADWPAVAILPTGLRGKAMAQWLNDHPSPVVLPARRDDPVTPAAEKPKAKRKRR